MQGTKYKTKQKECILSLLEEQKEKCFTVDEIFSSLNEKGEKVGRTTIYRTLKELKENGKVREYLSSRGECSTYQLSHTEECSHHLHLMCNSCGEVFHLDCECSEELETHFITHHGFLLDNQKTVIYGICEKCLGENK